MFYISGRADRMFISGGENIYPEEIESVAGEFSGIDSCAVISVENDKWGKRPILYVACDAPDKFEKAKLKSYLNSRLSKYKVPDNTVIIPEMPRSEVGKINYSVLTAQYEKEYL